MIMMMIKDDDANYCDVDVDGILLLIQRVHCS